MTLITSHGTTTQQKQQKKQPPLNSTKLKLNSTQVKVKWLVWVDVCAH